MVILHRNKSNVKKAIETADTLIGPKDFVSKMNISNWLFRLNLIEYASNFLKENITTVSDLKEISEKNLEKIGIKKSGDRQRILNMIKNDEDHQRAFEFMPHQSIQSFLGFYLKNSKKIENFLKIIPEEKITEFHLRDVFEKNCDKNVEEKINEMIEKTKLYYSEGRIFKNAEKKCPFQKNIEEFLKELNLDEKTIEKFREQGVLEPEYFYRLKQNHLKGLGVESFGMRNIIMKEIDKYFN